jgi:hypothetical protein
MRNAARLTEELAHLRPTRMSCASIERECVCEKCPRRTGDPAWRIYLWSAGRRSQQQGSSRAPWLSRDHTSGEGTLRWRLRWCAARAAAPLRTHSSSRATTTRAARASRPPQPTASRPSRAPCARSPPHWYGARQPSATPCATRLKVPRGADAPHAASHAQRAGIALETVWMQAAGRRPVPVVLAKHGLTPASSTYDLIAAAAAEAGLTVRDRAVAVIMTTTALSADAPAATVAAAATARRAVQPDVPLQRFAWRHTSAATAAALVVGACMTVRALITATFQWRLMTMCACARCAKNTRS